MRKQIAITKEYYLGELQYIQRKYDISTTRLDSQVVVSHIPSPHIVISIHINKMCISPFQSAYMHLLGIR